jgi:hypothetical protein
VSPEYPSINLDHTIAAHWRTRLAGKKGEDRAHWRTKTAYYRAVNDLIVARQQLSWHSIVGAVFPKGSRSTFYDVTGPRSKHPLMRDYLAAARSESLQLALSYRRHKAVDQLVDETKVWSYWPARQAWLEQTRQAPHLRTAESMLQAISRWAHSHPELAAALDHAPPACTVEDLIAFHHGQLPAIRAWDIIRQAIAPSGGSAERAGEHRVDWHSDQRGDRPGDGLRINSSHPPAAPDPRIIQLAEQLCAVRHQMRLLNPTDALAVRETAAALMATSVRS